MDASVNRGNSRAQGIPELRRIAKEEADQGRADIEHFFAKQSVDTVPQPDQLEAIINKLLVPAWKAIGEHGVLHVIVEQNLRTRGELELCLADARAEVADRGRGAFMLRDKWKADGLPKDPKRLCAEIESHLAAFYIAAGALQLLEAMLGAAPTPS